MKIEKRIVENGIKREGWGRRKGMGAFEDEFHTFGRNWTVASTSDKGASRRRRKFPRRPSLWTRLLLPARTHARTHPLPLLSSRETIVISTNSCSPRRLNETRNTLKSRSCLNTTVSIVRSRSRNRRLFHAYQIRLMLQQALKIVRHPHDYWLKANVY